MRKGHVGDAYEAFWKIVEDFRAGEMSPGAARRLVMSDRIVRKFSVAQALRLGHAIGQYPHDQADALALVGFLSGALEDHGRFREAEAVDEWLAPELERAGQLVAAAESLLRRSDCLERLGTTWNQGDAFGQAATWLEQADLPATAATAHHAEGSRNLRQRQFVAAASSLSTAALIYHAFDDLLARAECLAKLAEAWMFLDEYWPAIGRSRTAERIFRQLGRREEAARCRICRASGLTRLGRLRPAIAHFDRAEKELQQLDAVDDLPFCRFHRARALLAAGRFDEALEDYQQVAAGARGQLQVNSFINLGNTLQELAQFDDAVQWYEAAIAQCETSGEYPDLHATARMNRAGAMRFARRFEESLAELEEVQPYFECERLPGQALTAALLRSDVLMSLHRYEEGLAVLEQFGAPDWSDDWRSRYHAWRGAALASAGKHRAAVREMKKALQSLWRSIDAGTLDESNVDFAAMRLRVVSDAIAIGRASDNIDFAWWALQAGKAALYPAHRHAKDLARGIPASIQTQRADLCAWLCSGQYQEFERRLEELSEELSDSDEARHEGASVVGNAIQQETARHATSYLRTVQRIELRRAPGAGRRRSLAERGRCIQEALPAGWGVLDMYFRSGEFAPFLVTRDAISLHPAAVDWTAREFCRSLRQIEQWKGYPARGRNDALVELYDRLVAPLRPQLEGLQGLYVVPFYGLHLIPFHGLQGPQGDWANELAISYLPCAEWLTRLHPWRGAGRALSIVNPDAGTTATLPLAEWEADRLTQLVGADNHDVLRGPDARLQNLPDWSDCSVLHLAAHGSGYAPLPLLSHVHLRECLLLADDVLRWCPRVREGALVALNLCESGTVDPRSMGFGLAEAFLAAGASCVLSSQWRIHDFASAEFFRTFADEVFGRQQAPAVALQSARARLRSVTAEEVIEQCRNLRRDSFPQESFPEEWRRIEAIEGAMHKLSDDECAFDHPYYWAPFRLVGRIH